MRKIINFFKIKKYSVYVPITIYDHSGNKYIIQGRKNLKTGELVFKCTRINNFSSNLHNIEITLVLDVKVQMNKLIEL